MIDQPKLVPLDAMRPADLRRVTVPGLLVPVHHDEAPWLVTLWDGVPFTVALDADRNYPFWQIKHDTRVIGVFFEKPRLIVNLDSIARGRKAEALGALVLSEGAAHIVAQSLADRFADPVKVPLWTKFPDTECEEEIAFLDWRIVIGEGIEQRTLWSPAPVLMDLDPALAA